MGLLGIRAMVTWHGWRSRQTTLDGQSTHSVKRIKKGGK